MLAADERTHHLRAAWHHAVRSLQKLALCRFRTAREILMAETFDYDGWQLTHSAMLLRSQSGDAQLPPTALLVAIDDTDDPRRRPQPKACA